MPIEAALIKPVVDALMGLFRQGEHLKLKHDADKAVREAIRELLLANPDENKAAARIAIAKAAGILSEDVLLAEDMLKQHRATKSRTSGKAGSSRKRKSAAAAGEAASKSPAATETAPRKRKPAAKTPPRDDTA